MESVRDRVKALRLLVDETAAKLAEVVLRRLAWELARFTLREAEERRRHGQLEFHDLLVLARAVLRDPEHGWDVRQRLRARYTRLLLDEFQDTDPIQCDLAALLASGAPDARAHRWDELPVDPGRLFVVGDPKQSIYRFRRADIAAFLRARSAFGAAPRRLTRQLPHRPPGHRLRQRGVPRSHRRGAGVATRVRGARTRARGRAGGATGRAPRCRPPSSRSPPPTSCASARHATWPRSSGVRCAEGWQVSQRSTDGIEQFAPCRLGDLCVLLPARTSLGQLEDALDAAGIPYRAETSSLVYSTREIRDLLVVLQAVDDPTDELALVARAAITAVRVRRRRPLHLQGGARRPLEPPAPPAGDVAARPPGRRRDPGARRVARRPSVALAQRAARPHRARAARARGRLRPRPTARPVAARAVRDRTGARVRGGRGWQPARLPRLGRPPGQRGGACRRDGAARDRRRRGAHPHHPRRQGARVPDHDRVGHDDQGTVAHRRCAAALPPRPRHVCAAGLVPGHDRGVRALRADRRADGLPREAAAPLRGHDPRPRPPRGVGAPGGEGAGRGPDHLDARAAAVARRGRRAGVERVRRRCGRSAAHGDAAGRRHPGHTPAVGRVATRARRRVRARGPPQRPLRDRDRPGGRGGGGGGPRAAQGPARPRAAALEQGPLRHRARPCRARGPADDRSRHR